MLAAMWWLIIIVSIGEIALPLAD